MCATPQGAAGPSPTEWTERDQALVGGPRGVRPPASGSSGGGSLDRIECGSESRAGVGSEAATAGSEAKVTGTSSDSSVGVAAEGSPRQAQSEGVAGAGIERALEAAPTAQQA